MVGWRHELCLQQTSRAALLLRLAEIVPRENIQEDLSSYGTLPICPDLLWMEKGVHSASFNCSLSACSPKRVDLRDSQNASRPSTFLGTASLDAIVLLRLR